MSKKSTPEMTARTLPGGALEITTEMERRELPQTPQLFNNAPIMDGGFSHETTIRGDHAQVRDMRPQTHQVKAGQTDGALQTRHGTPLGDVSMAKDTDLISIGGTQTTLGNAKRMGLVSVRNGQLFFEGVEPASNASASEKPSPNGDGDGDDKPANSVNLEPKEATRNLNVMLDKMGGSHRAVAGAVDSMIGHLSKGPDGLEGAAQSMAHATGDQPEEVRNVVSATFDRYAETSRDFIKRHLKADPDKVGKWLDGCSANYKANVMRMVFRGHGPQILREVVERANRGERI